MLKEINMTEKKFMEDGMKRRPAMKLEKQAKYLNMNEVKAVRALRKMIRMFDVNNKTWLDKGTFKCELSEKPIVIM
jgi:hypothetical protein